MKYTKEHEEIIRDRYTNNSSKETVAELAEQFGVTTRSIIGKLSRMGIYQREVYTPKYSDKPISKEEIVFHIANELNLDVEKLAGLSKSQKPALLYLEDMLVKQGIIESRE